MGRHPTILYCIRVIHPLRDIFTKIWMNQRSMPFRLRPSPPLWHSFQFSILDIPKTRVAEVGSLLVRAKIVIKTFIKQVFTIFATNVCFFVRKCKLANLIQCNMRYIQCNSAPLAKEALFLTKKGTCFVQSTGSPPHQKWTAS